MEKAEENVIAVHGDNNQLIYRAWIEKPALPGTDTEVEAELKQAREALTAADLLESWLSRRLFPELPYPVAAALAPLLVNYRAARARDSAG